ncbi:TetR/AcrR family transcriptional regulator [Nonlabens ponticola]|uniref:TetR/AcrR family transcriptional regulator n=1 Tax=Nonlabens ponticola TaxID=2496866 RepID=A0A3S9MUY1_9FLAO|nr:TetR/AcrR family transcriptional regulator [Nonlabens ponticola]AZQ42940.1 TetR/AcrR family transcriptional regulator [Nonlabens ponticola]
MEVKERILEESMDLFLTLGFKSVTMDEIASRLGMSKKTLYTHYRTKGSLVDAASVNFCEHVCNGVDDISASESANPIEELYDVKKFVMQQLRGDNTSPVYQLKKYYPEVHRKVELMQFDHMDKCIKRNVERGIEQGFYRDNIDAAFVARMYFVGIQGIKNISIFPAEDFPVNDLYDQYLEYHLRGIVTPAGRKILNELTDTNHE